MKCIDIVLMLKKLMYLPPPYNDAYYYSAKTNAYIEQEIKTILEKIYKMIEGKIW